MKLSIIILHYKGKKLLQACLDSIFAALEKKPLASGLSLELVLIDNGSTDGSADYLKTIADKKLPSGASVRLIFNHQNLGFAAGNNIGIEKAIKNGADYIMLLNNDVKIADHFWQPLLDFIEKRPNVGLVAPKIYFAPGYEFHQDRYKKEDLGKVIWFAGGIIDWDNVYAFHQGVDQVDIGQFSQPAKISFATGCCLMASADTWRKINLIDPSYFLYFEDVDLSMKVKSLGLQIYCVPSSKIWHMNAGSSSSGGQLQDYFITRNRMLFGFRWASKRTKLALLRESLRLLISGRPWQKKGIIDFYLKRFGKGRWQ